jgi:hypothetical protein
MGKSTLNSVGLLLAIWAPCARMRRLSDTAEEWRASGSYFTWRSTLPENQGKTVQVFYTCIGDAAKPVIVMLHGFPTSSFDFRVLIPLLLLPVGKSNSNILIV